MAGIQENLCDLQLMDVGLRTTSAMCDVLSGVDAMAGFGWGQYVAAGLIQAAALTGGQARAMKLKWPRAHVRHSCCLDGVHVKYCSCVCIVVTFAHPGMADTSILLLW